MKIKKVGECMILVYMLILTILGFISFVPVTRLYEYRDYKAFKPLTQLVSVVFVWTFVLIFKFLVINSSFTLAYYLHLFGYIAITSTLVLFIRTVFHFMGKPFNKPLNIIVGIYIGVWSVIVLTNDITNWVVLADASDISSVADLLNMQMHPLFFIHTLFLYALSTVVLAILYINLLRRKRSHIYRVPRYVFIGMAVLSVLLNIVHNFIYAFYLDPSYIAIVIFSYLLYTMIYKKDMGFILFKESRKTLLENMRELYFVADDMNVIVDCSNALRIKYGISEGISVDEALFCLKEKAVLYRNIKEVSQIDSDRPFLYTIHKTFSPENYNVKGVLHLFYDETKFVELVRKLEYLKSYDEMTGLYNRNHFERSIKTYDETYPSFGIIVCDVNGLKLFNDYFGHKAGDTLIIRFSTLLKKITEAYETVSLLRIGGDEFAIFIGNATKTMLEEIEDKIKKETFHENPLKRLSIATGSAIRKDSEDVESTMLRADQKLYKYKSESSSKFKECFLKAYENTYKK